MSHTPFQSCIRPCQPWTDQEIDTLKSLATTITRVQLAEKLGRSLASIGNKAHSLGIKLASGYHPKIKEHREKVAEACRLYSEGFGASKISRILNVHPSTVYNWISERHRSLRPAMEDREATIIIRQSLKEIAEKHGLKPSDVHLLSKHCAKKLAARDEAIKLAHVRGVSKPQLVRAFLKSPQTINAVIRNTP